MYQLFRRVGVVLLGTAFAMPMSYASSHTHTSSSRPYYGGGHHTTSHGGHYAGETNSHHKNGHYSNPKTSNRYGVHKTQ